MTDEAPHVKFRKLVDYLARIPAVDADGAPDRGVGVEESDSGWRVTFAIDIDHELAWETVQELGHALNGKPAGERPPTVFKPVSPTPSMSGGPEDDLSWVIEAPGAARPEAVAEWLEDRLPNPVEDEAAWMGESDDEDDGDEDDDEDDGDDDD